MKNFFKINRALVAKKKFFTLTLALMASFSLWAAEIYSTDVLASISGATISQDKGTYTTGSATSWSGNLENYFLTNGSAGYYQISFSSPISLEDYTDIKIKVYWGSTSNRPLNLTINGGSATKIDEISASADRSKVREPESNITASSLSSIKFSSSGGGNVYLFRFEITGTPATPAVTHTLEWDFDEGDCSATPGTDYTAAGQVAEGATITYPADNTMTKDGYDFNGWSTSVTTMPTSDLTITAQWVEHTTSTDATLSALSVAGCTLSPAFAPATTAYTIALPFYASMPAVGAVTATKNDSYAKTPAVSISDNVITVACEAEDGTKINYTITVNIAPAPTASSSINIEQWVLDNQKGKDDAAGIVLAKALFDAHNIGYVSPHALDSLNDDPSKTNRNEAYLGAKIKAADSQIKVILPASNYLKVKFGNRSATVRVSINGSSPADATITENVYTLPASSEVREVVFSISKAATVVFKQIMINAEIETVTLPWRVTYDAGLGECATTEAVWFGTALVLPEISTLPSGKQFDGWYDAETSGTKVGDAGDTYTPEANVTLYAYYSTATALDNTDASVKAVKYFKDGQLFIEKNGKIYNAMGIEVR